MKHQLKQPITEAQGRDTGMAMVLLMLILYGLRKREIFVVAAVVLQVVNMTAPKVFRPVAVVWLGVSEFIGSVVSKILLAFVFFVVVTPIGMIRRFMRKDSMRLQAFKRGSDSVMIARDHLYVGVDLERPY